MEILNKIYLLLISTRAKSVYWNMFYIGAVGLASLFLENIADLGLPVWAVVVVGGILTQISKGLANKRNGMPMGWE